ncbi:hypothetical protein Drorol1_Dr00019640 [Drosera rotundifolia]
MFLGGTISVNPCAVAIAELKITNGPNHSGKRGQDEPEMGFSVDDGTLIMFPHDDALVLILYFEDFDVERILIDSGSSANVLYYTAFKKMGFKDENLKPFKTPLVGFIDGTKAAMAREAFPLHLIRKPKLRDRNPWKS